MYPSLRVALLITLVDLLLLPVPHPAHARMQTTGMNGRIIRTQYGMLRGVLVTLDNPELAQVEAYLGLQYASIHGGELRFMPPTSPLQTWDGIKVALNFPPVCPQVLPDIDELEKTLPLGRVDHYKRLLPFLRNQHEECLNLNIYVPIVNNSTGPRGLLPVVMFIHGETYSIGTGNAYDGSVLAAYGQVIVITLNFRMGILGFLSTGDSNAPGNYALLDQVAALHWIRENIEAFGGDKNQVTLMGQGYGAAMVHLLLISPVTRGKHLFQRAILQSGSALSSWAITPNPVHYTHKLAEKVNCSEYTANAGDLLVCLKKVPWEELIRHEKDIQAPKYFTAFGPVVDKRSVLPTSVRNLMERPMSVFGDIDVLVGLMRNEGFLLFNQTEIDEGVSQEKKVKMLRTYVRNLYHFHRQKIYEIILHHYSDWEKPSDPKSIRDELMDLLGDAQYVAPVMEFTEMHARFLGSTYLYSFSYPSRLDSYPRWAGGVRGDDMTYIFGAPLTDGIDPFTSSFTRSEKMLTEAVMTYWTNFIKSGNPNLPLDQDSVHSGKVKNRFSDVEWLPFSHDEPQYLHIGKGSVKPDGSYGMRPTIRDHYRASKMALWLDLIPKIHKSDDLEMKYHLLEDYNNASSFESVGTQKLDMKRLFPPPPINPPFPPTTTPRATSTAIRKPTTTTTTLPPPPTRRPRPKATTMTMFPPKPDMSITTQPPEPEVGGLAGMDARLSMSVTLAVGCSLLFLNIVIFAGVYYQKDRMRVEMKMRKLELEKEKEATLGGPESEGVKSTSSPDSDTNSSSMATPPIPPSLNHRHPPPPNHQPPCPPGIQHHGPQHHGSMQRGISQHNQSPHGPQHGPPSQQHGPHGPSPLGPSPHGPHGPHGPQQQQHGPQQHGPPPPRGQSPHGPNPPHPLSSHAQQNSMPKTAIPVLPPQAPYQSSSTLRRSPRLPQRPMDLHHPPQGQHPQGLPPSHPQSHPLQNRHHMSSHPDIMNDSKLRHSSSADSGTDVNNHCPNPSTVV